MRKYVVTSTVKITTQVEATSLEEAKEIVASTVPGVLVKQVGHRNWQDDAFWMLNDGMSYNEVARTIGVDRASIVRKFPGYGWTRSEGGKLAQANRTKLPW